MSQYVLRLHDIDYSLAVRVVRGLGRAFLYLYYHVTGFSPLCCCERGGFYPLGVFGGEGLKTANCEFRCKIPEGQPFTRISL